MLTGPEAGITRDTIASRSGLEGQIASGCTTPPECGVRRGCEEKLGKALGRRCDQFHPLCRSRRAADGFEHPFEEQDLRIAALVEREGRALVIGISKWDLKARKAGAIGKLPRTMPTTAAASEGPAGDRRVGPDRRRASTG